MSQGAAGHPGRGGRWRSFLAGARDVSPLFLGVLPFGFVAGAAVAEAGFGLPEALGMAVIVNAGAAHLAATTLFAQGAPLLVALGTALVVNARLLIYSTSIAPVIAPPAGKARPLVAHMLVDQAYAATMMWGRKRPDTDIVCYFAGTWVPLAMVWWVANAAGALAGNLVPAEWSLDYAIPLVFLAMLVPSLESRVDVEVVLATGVAAAFLVPALPMQLGLVAAIFAGMIWGAVRERSDTA
ncbi:MAG: hypothetical protein Kow0056_15430 [Coriobacteriia bacterium]